MKHLNYTPIRICILFFVLIFSSFEKEDDIVKTTITTTVYGVVKDCHREIPLQNYKVIVKERQPSLG